MLGMKTDQSRVADTTLRRLRAAAQQRYGAVVTPILSGCPVRRSWSEVVGGADVRGPVNASRVKQ